MWCPFKHGDGVILPFHLPSCPRKWRLSTKHCYIGADQFEEDNPKEGHSKVTFFSYFYLALNIGYLFSNTILGYFENEGMWALGFGCQRVCICSSGLVSCWELKVQALQAKWQPSLQILLCDSCRGEEMEG